MQNIDRKKIINIYLFGSVVREETHKDSDIDLFIESQKDIQEEINKITDKFYKSSKYLKYWKPLNIKNQIKCIVGNLKDYPDLKRSIISNSIVLYSQFKEKLRGKNYSLFLLEFKGDFKDKVRLWRKLYGYKQTRKDKKYETKGIIEQNQGKKLSKGVFITPIENSNQVIKELKNLKIKYKIFDISSDTL